MGLKDFDIQVCLTSPDRTYYQLGFSGINGFSRAKEKSDFVSSSKATYASVCRKYVAYNYDGIKLGRATRYLYMSFNPDNKNDPPEDIQSKIAFAKTGLNDAAELAQALKNDPNLYGIQALVGITSPTVAKLLERKFGFNVDPNGLNDIEFKLHNDPKKKTQLIVASPETFIRRFERYQGKIPTQNRVPRSGLVVQIYMEVFGKKVIKTLWS